MLRQGLKGPLWIMALAVGFWLFDQVRGLLNINLGRFPMALKRLYIRVLSFQLGYPDQRETPMSWREDRALMRRVFGLPKRLRYAYYGWYIMARWGHAVPAGAATIQGSRSGLLWKQTPGGLPVIVNAQHFSGNVFFVDANAAQTGTTSGFGTHPDKAVADLDSARALCTASQGDAIFVLPGHTENIASAADINLSVAGVSVIGLGRGQARPTFSLTATGSDLEIDGASVLVQNILFLANVASITAAIDVDAAGFCMEDCDFMGTDAADEAPVITVITDAAANDMTIRRCNFNYLGAQDGTAITATPTECIRLVGADRAVIQDCYISGDFTTSAINGITTASRDVRIIGNHIHNIATEDIAGIVDLVAGCNGVISSNKGFMGYASSLAAIIDPASCAMVENRFSNVVTEAGGLVGTAST